MWSAVVAGAVPQMAQVGELARRRVRLRWYSASYPRSLKLGRRVFSLR